MIGCVLVLLNIVSNFPLKITLKNILKRGVCKIILYLLRPQVRAPDQQGAPGWSGVRTGGRTGGPEEEPGGGAEHFSLFPQGKLCTLRSLLLLSLPAVYVIPVQCLFRKLVGLTVRTQCTQTGQVYLFSLLLFCVNWTRGGFGLSPSPRARSPQAFFAGPHQPATRSPARKTQKSKYFLKEKK